MQSRRRFAVVSLLAACAGQVLAQDLETRFQATRGRPLTDPSSEAFRRTPGACALLRARLQGSQNDSSLAVEHLQRMPTESAAAAGELLQLATTPDLYGLQAAVAIGNVAPWWPAERRADARRALEQLFPRVGNQERAALSRSYTRTTLAVTSDLAKIEAMLVSDDPFQIEFGLHQLEQLESAARPLLPLLRTMAATAAWPVAAEVRGTPRELPCAVDWTPLIRERLYWAVRRIDAADPLALPFYLERLPKAPAHLQFDYLQQFGRMGQAAAAALPQVTALSRSRDRLLAREAVTVLGMIGVPEAAAIERLRELQDGDDRQLAMRARSSLRQLQGADARQ